MRNPNNILPREFFEFSNFILVKLGTPGVRKYIYTAVLQYTRICTSMSSVVHPTAWLVGYFYNPARGHSKTQPPPLTHYEYTSKLAPRSCNMALTAYRRENMKTIAREGAARSLFRPSKRVCGASMYVCISIKPNMYLHSSERGR